MTKIRNDCRKLIIEGKIYQYKIGRMHVKIYSPNNKLHHTDLSKVTGFPPDTIERMLWKGTNGFCGPEEIKNYILKEKL